MKYLAPTMQTSSENQNSLSRLRAQFGARRGISFQVLTLAFLGTLSFSTTLLIISNTLQVPLPGVFERGLSEIGLTSGDSIYRTRYLESIERAQQAELAGKVHYITQLITSIRPDTPAPKSLAFSIVQQARRANFDPILVAAVINSESTFRVGARSPVGALGLMQIMPDTGRFVARMENFAWNGPQRLTTDGDYNIKFGIRYLQYLLKLFDGDLKRVLIAYNWGPANLERALREGSRPPSSTIRYAATIIANHAAWAHRYKQQKSSYQGLGRSYLPK